MSDYLTDEEQLEKLKNWWEQNGLMLIGAVIVAVAGVIGWNWYGTQQADQIAEASDLYTDYLAAEGAEQEAIEAALAAGFPESTYRVFILLRHAQQKMNEEDSEAGLDLLSSALEIADDARLADLIRLRTARVQQQLDQSEAALSTLAQVKSLGLRSQVQELKGDIHMTRGERAEAFEAYSAALSETGESAQRPLLEMKVADTADTDGA